MTDALILASTSPRRRALLAEAGLRFEVVPPGADGGVDERVLPGEAAARYVARLAQAKAQAGLALARTRDLPPWPVLGADTTVCLDGRILGKPADASEASAMLALLSGQTHEVLTALCLTDGVRSCAALSRSQVRFAPLHAADIAAYVATGEPFDKAGGYGIQGRGALLVAHLSGSHSGVMGLPLHELGTLLRHFSPHPAESP